MPGTSPLPVPALAAPAPALPALPPGPRPFFVYWRSQRRQFFSFRARVVAWSPGEARARFVPRRGPEPRVVGVKAAAGWGSDAVALSGRWVG